MENSKSVNTDYIIYLFKDFSRYVLQKWFIVGAVLFLGGVTSAVFVWLQKPKYKAELTFALEDAGGGSGSSYANLAAQLGFNLGNSSSGIFKGDNLLELMKSRFIMEKTLLTEVDFKGKRGLLVNFYLDITGKGKDYVSNKLLPANYYPNNLQEFFSSNQDSVLYVIQKEVAEKYLSVSRIDKKLSIISISVNFYHPLFAKVFCEKLVENTISFYVQTVTKKEQHNVQVLEHQADSLRNLMAGAMSSAAASNDLNVNPARQILRVGSQRSQIDANVFGIAYGEILKNLELSKISLRRETPLIQIIDSPRLPLQNLKSGRISAFIIGLIVTALFLFPILVIAYKLSSAKTKQVEFV